jgi:predicted ester cyclase
MSEQNKMLARRSVEEVWNGDNFAAVDELVTSDIVIHSAKPGDEIHGPKGLRQFYATLHEAFPDIHFTIEDQIAEGRVPGHSAHRQTN